MYFCQTPFKGTNRAGETHRKMTGRILARNENLALGLNCLLYPKDFGGTQSKGMKDRTK